MFDSKHVNCKSAEGNIVSGERRVKVAQSSCSDEFHPLIASQISSSVLPSYFPSIFIFAPLIGPIKCSALLKVYSPSLIPLVSLSVSLCRFPLVFSLRCKIGVFSEFGFKFYFCQTKSM